MKKAVGFINLHGNPELGKLTEKRPLAAVSFLGRYALIDFALSNFTNSDIHKTEILVETHLDSIRSHIHTGAVWVTNTKTGFLRATINEDGLMNPEKNTDIKNIFNNVPKDITFSEDYIVIASPAFLMSIDYREVLKYHAEQGAGITVIYTKTKDVEAYQGCDQLIVDKDNTVRKFIKPKRDHDHHDIGIENYVFSRSAFEQLLRFSREVSNTEATLKRMVELFTNNKMVKVVGYEYLGAVFPVLSLKQYVETSFKMLEYKERRKLFRADWPIYTTSHNTPPSFYGPLAEVNNSFIANGAVIKGKVTNSIISRDVKVGEGAEINNCILFTKTEVGNNVKLKNVITDKEVGIKDVKNLVGDEEDYLLISRGAKI